MPAMPALLINASTEECKSPIRLPPACMRCAWHSRIRHKIFRMQMLMLSRNVLASLFLALEGNTPPQKRHLQCPG